MRLVSVVIFGQESPNLCDPYYTVLPYRMIESEKCGVLVTHMVLFMLYSETDMYTDTKNTNFRKVCAMQPTIEFSPLVLNKYIVYENY